MHRWREVVTLVGFQQPWTPESGSNFSKVWFLQQLGELQHQGLGFVFLLLSTQSPHVLEVHSLTFFGTLFKSGRCLLISISKSYPLPSLSFYATSLFLIEHLATRSCIICIPVKPVYLRTAIPEYLLHFSRCFCGSFTALIPVPGAVSGIYYMLKKHLFGE